MATALLVGGALVLMALPAEAGTFTLGGLAVGYALLSFGREAPRPPE